MSQMRKGTTAWIVLAALREQGETYGYGLRRAVFDVSKGLLPIKEGSLYPLLHVMKRDRLIQSRQQKVNGRWRRYYRITDRGRRTLKDCARQWKMLHSVLDKLGCHHVQDLRRSILADIVAPDGHDERLRQRLHAGQRNASPAAPLEEPGPRGYR